MKIALTYTGHPEKHQFYVDWLKAGSDIEVIRLSAEENNPDTINECDALVLSGGVDIHPCFYNSHITDYPHAPEFKEKRDEFEINVFKYAQENKLPVLGICRGLQLINVIYNGTLIQDLGDNSFNKIHRGGPDKSHPVTIEQGTTLFNIIGDEHAQINSAHHQAINKLGEELVINARAADGTIEGIERKDATGKPFLLAIQWHPERMFRFQLQDTAASKAIRNRFIEEIKKATHENH